MDNTSFKLHIDNLVGASCWKIAAGTGTGSVISLGFGDRIRRSRAISNPHLTVEERENEPEYGLIINCSWRLSSDKVVICGWSDSNERGQRMLKGLELLRNKKIIEVLIRSQYYDLSVFFEDNFILDVFCDSTNDYDTDDNYQLFSTRLNTVYIVGLNSILNKTTYY